MTEFGFSWSDIKTLKAWEYQELLQLIVEIDRAREDSRAQRPQKGAPPGMTRIV